MSRRGMERGEARGDGTTTHDRERPRRAAHCAASEWADRGGIILDNRQPVDRELRVVPPPWVAQKSGNSWRPLSMHRLAQQTPPTHLRSNTESSEPPCYEHVPSCDQFSPSWLRSRQHWSTRDGTRGLTSGRFPEILGGFWSPNKSLKNSGSQRAFSSQIARAKQGAQHCTKEHRKGRSNVPSKGPPHQILERDVCEGMRKTAAFK